MITIRSHFNQSLLHINKYNMITLSHFYCTVYGLYKMNECLWQIRIYSFFALFSFNIHSNLLPHLKTVCSPVGMAVGKDGRYES